MRWILLLLLLVGCSSYDTATVVRVIDGDTFVIDSGEHVRLIGMNTPERYEEGYHEATAALSDLVLDKEVKLEKDVSDKDKYHRLLRYVYIDDIFVNEELVRKGYAEVFIFYPDTKYASIFESVQS